MTTHVIAALIDHQQRRLRPTCWMSPTNFGRALELALNMQSTHGSTAPGQETAALIISSHSFSRWNDAGQKVSGLPAQQARADLREGDALEAYQVGGFNAAERARAPLDRWPQTQPKYPNWCSI